MTQLDKALELAARGIPVFPCKPETKAPITPNGFKDATTNAEQVSRWWTLAPDALIGMPTGALSGIDILDIDTSEAKGKVGAQSFIALTAANGVLEAPEVQTRSGGRHLFFQHTDGVGRRCGVVAKDIDVLGDNGYAIVWGDVPNAASLEPFPGWLVGLATRPTGPRIAATPRPAWAVDRVKRAFAVLPVDGVQYDYMRDALWATMDALGLTPGDAMPDWVAAKWVQADQTAECGRIWESNKNGGITKGTLAYFASQVDPNWDNTGVIFPPLALDEQPSEERLAWVASRYAYIDSWNSFVSRATATSPWRKRTRESVMERERQHMPLAQDTDKGATRINPIAWLLRPSTGLITADCIEYAPGREKAFANERGELVLNEWVDPAIEPLEPTTAERAAWNELLNHVFSDPAERDFYLKSMAYLVQNPTTRLPYGMLIAGKPHNGKTTLTSVVPKLLFGADNVAPIENEQTGTKFATFFNKRIVAVEEIWQNRREDAAALANRMKSWISNGQVTVERKGHDLQTQPNVTTFLASSNKEDALKLADEASERRWFVTWSEASALTEEQKERIYTKFLGQHRGDGSDDAVQHRRAAGVLTWLFREVDLTNFVLVPLATTARHKMVADSADHAIRVIRERADAHEPPFAHDVFELSGVKTSLESEFRNINSAKVADWLRDAGFVKLKEKSYDFGKLGRPYLWARASDAKRLRAMSPEMLRALYEKTRHLNSAMEGLATAHG